MYFNKTKFIMDQLVKIENKNEKVKIERHRFVLPCFYITIQFLQYVILCYVMLLLIPSK